MQNISYWILAQYEPVSSLNWLHNRELQSSYMLYGGDRTWERAVEEIKKGNRACSQRGREGFGDSGLGGSRGFETGGSVSPGAGGK